MVALSWTNFSLLEDKQSSSVGYFDITQIAYVFEWYFHRFDLEMQGLSNYRCLIRLKYVNAGILEPGSEKMRKRGENED